MNAFLLQLAIYLVVLLVLAKPLGSYMAGVFGDKPSRAHWLGPVERLFYRVAGVNPQAEMGWKRYALAVIVVNVLGALAVYALQRAQQWLPLNPQGFGAITPDSSFNTAISFVSNTNWQGYSGESTMSYLTQMLGLAVQNFLSAATGIAVVIALIRGFARHSANTIGNFWVDFTRATVYVLLPLSIIVSVFFVSQGVIQNFDGYKEVSTVTATTYDNPKVDASGNPIKDAQGNPVTEKATTQTQTLPMGPVASQEAIKMLGTNGGGFFNANSAHPYENPNALTNFVQMLAIFIIPAALCFTFGGMVGDGRQGWAVLAAMTVLFVVLATFLAWAELHANPMLANLGIDQAVGNMEGKETRFGIVASSLFATITTAASCGAVNAMHDSLTALGGFVPMFLMQLGEVVFGGVGSGLYGMLVYAILAVFIAGLMIGRTPEYLGKKIEVFEMKMTSIAILVTPLLVLVGTAVAVVATQGKAGIFNPGTHGFSEVLYAFSSAANNNGSAFAGLSANTPFYNVALGIAMWLGRFWIIVPVLAMAGTFAAKKRLPVTAGTLPTHGPLFVVLLIGSVLLVGALTYIPALALGPIAEHLAR
ncbi:Potassium-transporting ATPase potassium-binding subunit [Ralstonia psammae]|uniref:Potassium-transporting ATPase potassium-binding subunit n=1 Tax=Ralstonia psammae TaxID=3058598 RepID=A0ABN9IVD1_9RALS|nr:potassium-transporting ATPase subunit KdpA [Ralstonia sp. LMG 19083]CAJ0794134.1 Potassium-transporting ATPase potassium-binding subunit [Ralstonia sp. LMG 19083]